MFFGRRAGDIYYDRGDILSDDFAVGDLTTNAAWQDLDLSSIVPAGAKVACIRVLIRSGSAGHAVQFRKNGNIAGVNTFQISTQAANVGLHSQGFVALDANRVIEYVATNTVWTNIDIIVLGWFK